MICCKTHWWVATASVARRPLRLLPHAHLPHMVGRVSSQAFSCKVQPSRHASGVSTERHASGVSTCLTCLDIADLMPAPRGWRWVHCYTCLCARRASSLKHSSLKHSSLKHCVTRQIHDKVTGHTLRLSECPAMSLHLLHALHKAQALQGTFVEHALVSHACFPCLCHHLADGRVDAAGSLPVLMLPAHCLESLPFSLSSS